MSPPAIKTIEPFGGGMLLELAEAFAISLTWRLEGAISREVETSMLAFPPVISTGPKATMGGGFGALIKPDARMYKTAEMTTETRTTTTTTTTMIKARLSRRGGGAG